MINCVSIKNNHLFERNLLAEQYQLRFKEITQRLNWEVPHYGEMEYDEYDTPASSYFLWNQPGRPVQAMCRIHPTSTGCMITDHFNFLTNRSDLLSDEIYEGTRMVADHSLSQDERRQAIKEIVVAFIEYGLDHKLDGYVGIMPPKVWESTFQRAGWDIEWLGDTKTLDDNGGDVRAAFYPVSEEVEDKIRQRTGIKQSILNYGKQEELPVYGVDNVNSIVRPFSVAIEYKIQHQDSVFHHALDYSIKEIYPKFGIAGSL
jgi:N-acyl-L-homoserine lactone synthetase